MSKDSEILRAQVLIVEDEQAHADVMADALRKPGHVCTIVSCVDDAITELKGGSFDVIVTDLRMPNSAGKFGISPDGADAGMHILKRAHELQPNAETVMVTAHGDVKTARAAFKIGAYDFIEKPLDLELFRSLVNRAAETVLLRHATGTLTELVQHDGFEGIIAGSEPMRRILDTVKTVSASNLAVLVSGESGTGKELIANAIHRNSPRAQSRFVAFNCAGQSESLLEDQLFGHVKGAFTGADKDREGVFEYATGGTLFLDEIGDMPQSMQAKLLRVLEVGEIVRLGANDARPVDVRLVSATNQNLEASVSQGTFRGDLYFRIKGAEIHLPPLRDRREDIPRIVRHAAAKCATELGFSVPEVTDAAMLRLTSYDWPGNVRQLLNVVQNMVVTAHAGTAGTATPPSGAAESADIITVQHIPADIVSSSANHDDAELATSTTSSLAGTPLEQLEKRAIRETLRLTGGNRQRTAELLGIGERTLYRKLKEYGLR